MNRPITRNPTERTRAVQAEATDPGLFAWVSANAGSGKTTVLVRRIQRLLLNGVEPPQILCLTYTDAAAANMKNRLLKELSDWVGSPDEKLAETLQRLLQRQPSPADLRRARELFAVALQSPGGLKIGTIHGFCTRILQIAPFEANVPSRFDVLDETSAGLLMAEALDQVLASAAHDGGMAASLAVIGEELSGQERLMTLLREAAARRHLFLEESGEPMARDDYRRRAAGILEITPDEDVAAVINAALGDVPDPTSLRHWASELAARPLVTDRKIAQKLLLIAGSQSLEQAFAAWQDLVIDSKGRPKDKLLTTATASIYPETEERLVEIAARIDRISGRLLACATLRRSVALQHVVGAVLGLYGRRKLARRALDFADLIAETRSLVTRVAADWLLYKLDSEIAHLLVDEAQDTSFVQWEIIAALTREFTAGSGTRRDSEPPRTVFAVGDEKQSIYSFQGAEPRAFDESRRHYQREVERIGLRFADLRLNQSFRSVQPVIQLVDSVFGAPERWQGLSSEADVPPQRHDSARGDDFGAVDLWPLEPAAPAVEREAWDDPPDTTGAPAAVLARRIARTLSEWTRAGVDDLGRRFAPGDVLILLPSRNALFGEIIRALRVADVPVAGVDRLNLTQHIAVQDLIAIGEALLLPDDDLTLATALKTPIFGLDDDDLLLLTADGPGAWIDKLQAAKAPRLSEAAALLSELGRLRHERGPHGFYAELLGRGGGYRRMVARLGTEAADALDAWLAAALAFETRYGPALAGFLAEMRMAERQVKRDLAEQQGEVRVMTVHGAKGLEAPVVILPDAGVMRFRSSGLRVMTLVERGGEHVVPLWVRKKDQDTEITAMALAAEQRRAEEEHNRLLYVALTRAEDRLIITGLDRKLKKDGTSSLKPSAWYRRIEAGVDAMADRFAEIEGPEGIGVRRFKAGTLSAAGETGAAPARPARTPLEPWLLTPARVEIEALPPMTASSPMTSAERELPAETPEGVGSAGYAALRARGLLAHLLLQHLPSVVPGDRRTAAMRLAEASAGVLGHEVRAAVIADVLTLLDHPALGALFGPDSLAEAPVAGWVTLASGERRRADGRVDRLFVGPDEVVFADFKTNAGPPPGSDTLPPTIMRQMAIYAALLRAALPGRRVSGLLIYTSGPHLITLSPEQLASTPIHTDALFKAA